MREKNDQVVHWEAQIAEIIKWYEDICFVYLSNYCTKSIYIVLLALSLV